jgi:hypothetical protein
MAKIRRVPNVFQFRTRPRKHVENVTIQDILHRVFDVAMIRTHSLATVTMQQASSQRHIACGVQSFSHIYGVAKGIN